MPPASPPPNESRRLAALRQTGILDTPPEALYDTLVDVVMATHSVPIAMIAFVDGTRTWCKSFRGLPAQECPRSQSFAAHVVSNGHSLTSLNAEEDPRFQDLPLVVGEPHVQFFAGAPIFMPGTDLCLGALCIVDPARRTPSNDCIEVLELQAQLTGQLLQQQVAAGETHGSLLRAVTKLGRAIDEPLQGAMKAISQAVDKPVISPELPSAQALLDTASQMLDHLLAFCTLQQGPLELAEDEFSLRQCVEAVMGKVAPEAQAKQLAFGYTMVEDIEAKGDVARIQQVLQNVVGNAVHYTSSGHVRLSVSAEDFLMLPGYLRLHFEVTDTGAGMPPQTLASATTPLATRCSHGQLESVGMGLAITQALCEAMAGHLEVDSRPGRGTICHLSITIPATRVPSPGTLSQKRVLVIDPSGPETAFLEWHCVQLGLQVSQVASVLDAEPTLRQTPPLYDAVLCTSEALESSTAPPGAVPVPWLVVCEGCEVLSCSWIRPFCTLQQPLLQSHLRDSLSSLWPVHAGAAVVTGKAEGQPLNIVVVEDDKLSRQVLVGLLKRLGCSVHAQHSSFRATRAATLKSYDIVFLQVRGPSLEGVDVAQRILQQQPGAFIVGIADSSVENVREVCAEYGLQDMLVKPIRYDVLAQVIKRYRATTGSKDTPRRMRPPRPPSLSHCSSESPAVDEFSEATWCRHTEPVRPATSSPKRSRLPRLGSGALALPLPHKPQTPSSPVGEDHDLSSSSQCSSPAEEPTWPMTWPPKLPSPAGPAYTRDVPLPLPLSVPAANVLKLDADGCVVRPPSSHVPTAPAPASWMDRLPLRFRRGRAS
eukprot:GGOE01001882.1.p1 GENE.GGOE01001882.1~~GGOE01001882.1.p1  ORF type:complete len:834 (-),score=193.13 GGOE01001882.1:240-2705(-)